MPMAADSEARRSASTPLDDAVKLAALRKQVEFYFSRANLANDAFLVSKMDSGMFVPVAVIAQFSKVKGLTNDEAQIVQALQGSDAVKVDPTGTKIRPNIKAERNTVILREIPKDTPEEEIRGIFEGLGAVKEVRADVGDTWFVVLESEEIAKEALLKLRLSGRKFKDNKIKARLKSENLLRSFMPVVPASGPTPAGIRGMATSPVAAMAPGIGIAPPGVRGFPKGAALPRGMTQPGYSQYAFAVTQMQGLSYGRASANAQGFANVAKQLSVDSAPAVGAEGAESPTGRASGNQRGQYSRGGNGRHQQHNSHHSGNQHEGSNEGGGRHNHQNKATRNKNQQASRSGEPKKAGKSHDKSKRGQHNDHSRGRNAASNGHARGRQSEREGSGHGHSKSNSYGGSSDSGSRARSRGQATARGQQQDDKLATHSSKSNKSSGSSSSRGASRVAEANSAAGQSRQRQRNSVPMSPASISASAASSSASSKAPAPATVATADDEGLATAAGGTQAAVTSSSKSSSGGRKKKERSSSVPDMGAAMFPPLPGEGGPADTSLDAGSAPRARAAEGKELAKKATQASTELPAAKIIDSQADAKAKGGYAAALLKPGARKPAAAAKFAAADDGVAKSCHEARGDGATTTKAPASSGSGKESATEFVDGSRSKQSSVKETKTEGKTSVSALASASSTTNSPTSKPKPKPKRNPRGWEKPGVRHQLKQEAFSRIRSNSEDVSMQQKQDQQEEQNQVSKGTTKCPTKAAKKTNNTTEKKSYKSTTASLAVSQDAEATTVKDKADAGKAVVVSKGPWAKRRTFAQILSDNAGKPMAQMKRSYSPPSTPQRQGKDRDDRDRRDDRDDRDYRRRDRDRDSDDGDRRDRVVRKEAADREDSNWRQVKKR